MTRIAAAWAGLLGLAALTASVLSVPAQSGGHLCRSGNLTQVHGTFERFAVQGEQVFVIPRGAAKAFPCKQVRGVLYTGSRTLMADCKPGMRFNTGGSLRAVPGGGFVVEAPAIDCRPGNTPAKSPADRVKPVINPEPEVNPSPRQPGTPR